MVLFNAIIITITILILCHHHAHSCCYLQIVTFGMNKRVGNISFPIKKSSEFGKKPYSDKLALVVDEEVRLLVGRAFKRTQEILDKNHDKLLKVIPVVAEDKMFWGFYFA